ncbi:MAG: ATP-binding cassette domain-containing protein [Treponema sp.]|nr:ATP-binding cassette domain-containing protein [Treponema sp.]
MKKYLLELKNVNFSAQDDRKIVDDVSVVFTPGKTTAIVGPSGCGKSTVLKLAAGLLLPNSGEVLYKEKNITLLNRTENLDFRRESAFVFQDSALWANMDLLQILELPLRIHFPKMTKSQRLIRVKDAVAKAGYKKDLNIRPHRLSMGEQKLIAFARAMICNPSILFLDECTESLDETAAERLIDVIRKKQREGTSILFISHDMRLIIDLADYIIVVLEGKIHACAPKDEIISDLLLNDFIKIGIAS